MKKCFAAIFVVEMQKAQMDQPFGLELANAMNKGGVLPKLFEEAIAEEDEPIVVQLKEMISGMTHSVAENRIMLHNVMSQLMELSWFVFFKSDFV